MGRPAKGEFTPTNPAKYVGTYPIIYRSSWELPMMTTFDKHPNVLHWSSESISIPYRNPLTNMMSMYLPDFWVMYADKGGKKMVELIEVKPEKEMPGYKGKVSKQTSLVQVINAAKWQQALIYCAKRNWHFRVASDKEMFAYKRKS